MSRRYSCYLTRIAGLALALAATFAGFVLLGEPWATLLLGTGMGGVSLGWWRTNHTRHHQAPNQIAKDPDITPGVAPFYPIEKPRSSRVIAFLLNHQG